MKKFIIGGIVLCMVMTTIVLAEIPVRLVRVEGFVVDDVSFQESANARSKKIVIEHHHEGAKLVFCSTEGRIYALVDQGMCPEVRGISISLRAAG